ncbi:hypothetical protein [Dyadobacter sp. 32]|uniref:hypothetical protein n=1 Tax=Dyadobacter sp. 32 TaxID=538966 RepID=UPI0011F0851C
MDPYKRIDQFDFWKNLILIISTIITFTLNLNDQYHLLNSAWLTKGTVKLITGFNAVLVITFIIIEIASIFIFQKAEGSRIIKFIDNSFNSNFSGSATPQVGFFNQDNINPGLYKMCINCFESTLFSTTIAKEMTRGKYIKAIIVLLIFVFTASMGDGTTFRYLTEAILPLALIQDAIRFSIYLSRLETVHASFTSFFTTINGNSSAFGQRISEALKLIITYETTLAWSSIKLDSKIYNKHNAMLSNEWTLLKQRYNI